MTQLSTFRMKPSSEYSGQAWLALAKLLPISDPNTNFWWQITGRHLASLVERAGYPLEKQYEAILTHYHWTLPYLGPNTTSNSLHQPERWISQVQPDGSPIEYSWKWNTPSNNSHPVIQYSIEPMGKLAGSVADPLNHQAMRDLLLKADGTFSSTDTTWSNHFLATLYDHDGKRYSQERAQGSRWSTNAIIRIELLPHGPDFKTYFAPRKLSQGPFLPLDQWEDAVSRLDPVNESRASLLEFLASSPEGKLLRPVMVSVDNKDPSESHLGWIFASPHTNFASVREIMTLAGRINHPGMDTQLADLFALMKDVLSLPEEFSEPSEIQASVPLQWGSPARRATRSPDSEDAYNLGIGHRYEFCITPGATLPKAKVIIQLRLNGGDDASTAAGLVSWMKAHGRGRYCDDFLKMLGEISAHRSLNDGAGIQTFLSCEFSEGGLDITSYLSPEAFHPWRQPLPRRRGMLRRDS